MNVLGFETDLLKHDEDDNIYGEIIHPDGRFQFYCAPCSLTSEPTRDGPTMFYAMNKHMRKHNIRM